MLATRELIAESRQPQRLAELVPRWQREIPLYRAASPPPNARTDGSLPPSRLPQWGFITKQDIRRGFPQNFLRDGVDLESLLAAEAVEIEHTSGTSEERTPLLLARGWWREQEARALRLNPFVAHVLDTTPGARRVTITSPVCNNDICYRGIPSHDERIVGETLHVNLTRHPFLWTEAELARMTEETLAWEPQFLDLDPVYGVLFARHLERARIQLPSLRFVLCSYEFVSVVHRRVLERVFGVPVLNLYGSTETGHLLMETADGDMAPSHETAFLELLAPDAAGVGELVVTTLTNDFMPLIRYRIGDLACRRELPYSVRYVVHGRVADALGSERGERVTPWQIDQCFSGLEGFLHYQLHETPAGALRLRFVPDGPGPADSDLEKLTRRLTGLLGSSRRIEWEAVDLLLAENSGKFRLCYPAVAAPAATL